MKNKELIPYAVLGLGSAMLIGSLAFFFIEPLKKALRKRVSTGGKFLFVGDSNFATIMSIADQLKKAYPQANITKVAESSQGTGWMLDNFKAELAKGEKYDAIVFLGGSNDLWRTDQNEVYSNLDAMYKMAKQNGAIVVAISPPNKNFLWGETRFCEPTQSNCKYLPDNLKRLDNLVEWIRTNPNKDIFINYHKITDRKDYFASDMQHGNRYAQQALFEEFKNKVL